MSSDHQTPESDDGHIPALRRWLATTETLAGQQIRIERLSGDVSPRRYFRVSSANPGAINRSAIAAMYPSQMAETQRRFAETTTLLEQVAVRVPRILESSPEEGWMLVEDLGTQTLFDSAAEGSEWLRLRVAGAARIPSKIQRLDARVVKQLNPLLNAEALDAEIDQTWAVFLEPIAGLDRHRGLGLELAGALQQINRDLGRGPQVPCHRDFMARNLVALEDGHLGVLDHQDLRLGPSAYDIASLLNDSLALPEEMKRPILELVLPARQLELYQRCVVQRCLKIVGTFYRFSERGEKRYLNMVPGAIRCALDALSTIEAVDGKNLDQHLTRHFQG